MPATQLPTAPKKQFLLAASELPIYNEAEAARLRGELREEALEQAANQVIARHEALRSTIEITDNEPMVVVHDAWAVPLKRIDLSAMPPAEKETQLERLLIEEPRRLHDLAKERGVRLTLIRPTGTILRRRNDNRKPNRIGEKR